MARIELQHNADHKQIAAIDAGDCVHLKVIVNSTMCAIQVEVTTVERDGIIGKVLEVGPVGQGWSTDGKGLKGTEIPFTAEYAFATKEGGCP